MNPYDPLDVPRNLTIAEREHYEENMRHMLDDPGCDPWDIWRCQQCLDGQG
jgi:hypothetical protein